LILTQAQSTRRLFIFFVLKKKIEIEVSEPAVWSVTP
jgi:hypothetical protein